jgi:hypothetical protein
MQPYLPNSYPTKPMPCVGHPAVCSTAASTPYHTAKCHSVDNNAVSSAAAAALLLDSQTFCCHPGLLSRVTILTIRVASLKAAVQSLCCTEADAISQTDLSVCLHMWSAWMQWQASTPKPTPLWRSKHPRPSSLHAWRLGSMTCVPAMPNSPGSQPYRYLCGT